MGDDSFVHKLGEKIEHVMEDADDAVTSPEAARVAWAEGTEAHGKDRSPAAEEPKGD